MKRVDCAPAPGRATFLIRRRVLDFGGSFPGHSKRAEGRDAAASGRLGIHRRTCHAIASLAHLQSGAQGMIVGIGSDLCNVERIQRSLDRFGDRFLSRVFTETEREKAASRPFTIAGTLAKRFAAKEAFSKAVGTGFKRGVYMKDIGVVNLPSGKPTLQLSGGAKARLDALAPDGHAIDIHLTMTDDHPWAQAFVILAARKLEP